MIGRGQFVSDLRMGLKTLWLHRLRSLLTLLGVVFGVASVIAMLAVGEGASKDALARLERLGSRNIILVSEQPTDAYDQQGQQQGGFTVSYGLLYEDNQRILDAFNTVKQTVPAKIHIKPSRLGEQILDLRIVGTTPGWFELFHLPLIAGRSLAGADLEEGKAVCVLTEEGARKLLAGRHTLGQSVNLGGQYFEVVGVVEHEAVDTSGMQTPYQSTDAYVPMSVFRAKFGDANLRFGAGSIESTNVELNTIILEVSDNSRVEATAEAVMRMLEHFHERVDYRVNVPLQLLREAEATKRTFNIVLGSIAGISLLVGGIGIMNIMLASVTERTKEIGIRRAVGAKRYHIISQFLIETVVLSSLGGLIGIVVGVAIPFVIERVSGMPTVVPFYGIALSLFISVGVGIVFGLYPAMRAAYLDPIQALRHE